MLSCLFVANRRYLPGQECLLILEVGFRMFVLYGLSSFVCIQRELGAGTSLVRPVIAGHLAQKKKKGAFC